MAYVDHIPHYNIHLLSMSILCFYFTQRVAYHIQVFALSRWLAPTLPLEYYEMSRGLQWSIPYYNFPWERGNFQPILVGSSSLMDRSSSGFGIHDSIIVESVQPVAGNPDSAAKVYGLPLTPVEYSAYFEV